MADPIQPSESQDDRFGFSEDTFAAVRKAHAGVLRMGSYVPTRHEVSTMAPKDLIPILQDWFWESPSELIPSKAQESAVMAILRTRPDAEEFSSFIREAMEFNSAGPAAALEL